jgi:hypothetical protein
MALYCVFFGLPLGGHERSVESTTGFPCNGAVNLIWQKPSVVTLVSSLRCRHFFYFVSSNLPTLRTKPSTDRTLVLSLTLAFGRSRSLAAFPTTFNVIRYATQRPSEVSHTTSFISASSEIRDDA